MASYLQGDYIPNVQNWSPNFNFYQGALQRRQSKYDAGWQKANSIYSSALNSPMMREENVERRDKFFEEIDGQVKQLSGVDLSLEQNVETAYKVFEPVFNDEDIVRDMSFTKVFQNEMSSAAAYEDCDDPDECGDNYWEGGVQLLQYQAEDFKNASREDALKMGNPEYIKYINTQKLYSEALKEKGISRTVDEFSGNYKYTYKNGDAVEGTMLNHLFAEFGSNSRIKKFHRAEAELAVRNNPDQAEATYNEYMKLSAKKEAEGSGEEVSKEEVDANVEGYYLQDRFAHSKSKIDQTYSQESNKLQLMEELELLEKDLIKKKEDYGKTVSTEELEKISENKERQEVLKNKLEGMKTQSDKISKSIKKTGPLDNKDKIISVLAYSMMINGMEMAAHSESMVDSEIRKELSKEGELRIKNKYDQVKEANKFLNDLGLMAMQSGDGSGGASKSWSSGYADLSGGTGGGNAAMQAFTQEVLAERYYINSLVANGMTTQNSGYHKRETEIKKQMQAGDYKGAAETAGSSFVIIPDAQTLGAEKKAANKYNDALTLEGSGEPGSVLALNMEESDGNDYEVLKKVNGQVVQYIEGESKAAQMDIDNAESALVGSSLGTVFSAATSKSDSTGKKEAILKGLIPMGDIINQRLTQMSVDDGVDYFKYDNYKKGVELGKLPQLTKDGFDVLQKMPTSGDNVVDADNKYYSSLKGSVGMGAISQLMGGNSEFENIYNSGTYESNGKTVKMDLKNTDLFKEYEESSEVIILRSNAANMREYQGKMKNDYNEAFLESLGDVEGGESGSVQGDLFASFINEFNIEKNEAGLYILPDQEQMSNIAVKNSYKLSRDEMNVMSYAGSLDHFIKESKLIIDKNNYFQTYSISDMVGKGSLSGNFGSTSKFEKSRDEQLVDFASFYNAAALQMYEDEGYESSGKSKKEAMVDFISTRIPTGGAEYINDPRFNIYGITENDIDTSRLIVNAEYKSNRKDPSGARYDSEMKSENDPSFDPNSWWDQTKSYVGGQMAHAGAKLSNYSDDVSDSYTKKNTEYDQKGPSDELNSNAPILSDIDPYLQQTAQAIGVYSNYFSVEEKGGVYSITIDDAHSGLNKDGYRIDIKMDGDSTEMHEGYSDTILDMKENLVSFSNAFAKEQSKKESVTGDGRGMYDRIPKITRTINNKASDKTSKSYDDVKKHGLNSEVFIEGIETGVFDNEADKARLLDMYSSFDDDKSKASFDMDFSENSEREGYITVVVTPTVKSLNDMGKRKVFHSKTDQVIISGEDPNSVKFLIKTKDSSSRIGQAYQTPISSNFMKTLGNGETYIDPSTEGTSTMSYTGAGVDPNTNKAMVKFTYTVPEIVNGKLQLKPISKIYSAKYKGWDKLRTDAIRTANEAWKKIR